MTAPFKPENPAFPIRTADALIMQSLRRMRDELAREAKKLTSVQGVKQFTQDMIGPGQLGMFKARMFHGSPKKGLTSINAGDVPRQYDNATSQLGAFFTPDEAEARRYAGKAGEVYDVDVHLQNEKEMGWGEFGKFQAIDKADDGTSVPMDQWGQRAEQLKEMARRLRETLTAEGHDGIVVRNTRGEPVEVASFNDVPLKARLQQVVDKKKPKTAKDRMNERLAARAEKRTALAEQGVETRPVYAPGQDPLFMSPSERAAKGRQKAGLEKGRQSQAGARLRSAVEQLDALHTRWKEATKKSGEAAQHGQGNRSQDAASTRAFRNLRKAWDAANPGSDSQAFIDWLNARQQPE